jgi:hypothetical protein
LIQRSGGGGGARVAEQKSLFACVADSVSEAAQQMTAIALPSDEEGNVHGVDSSSLVAMPQQQGMPAGVNPGVLTIGQALHQVAPWDMTIGQAFRQARDQWISSTGFDFAYFDDHSSSRQQ